MKEPPAKIRTEEVRLNIPEEGQTVEKTTKIPALKELYKEFKLAKKRIARPHTNVWLKHTSRKTYNIWVLFV